MSCIYGTLRRKALLSRTECSLNEALTVRVRWNVWFEGKLIRQDNKWVMTDPLGSVRANGGGERFKKPPW